MSDLDEIHKRLPQFHRTEHLPWKPNATKLDKIAKNAGSLFESDRVSLEEKVDGANCGMGILEGVPIVRNHNHVIHKGFNGKTPAKMQFSSVWNWWHENRGCFEKLDKLGTFTVYGEWCVAQHGVFYDSLPTWFIAHTVYDYEADKYVDTEVARTILTDCGFHSVPLLHFGKVPNFEFIEKLVNKKSSFYDGPPEGIYIKISDGKFIKEKYKLVRQGFEQGSLFSKDVLKKNRIAK